MLSKLFEPLMKNDVSISPYVETIQPLDEVVDGKLTRVSRIVKRCVADDFGGCSSIDFSINNLKAIGAYPKLMEIKMSMKDYVGFGAKIDDVASQLDKMFSVNDASNQANHE